MYIDPHYPRCPRCKEHRPVYDFFERREYRVNCKPCRTRQVGRRMRTQRSDNDFETRALKERLNAKIRYYDNINNRYFKNPNPTQSDVWARPKMKKKMQILDNEIKEIKRQLETYED